VPSASTTLAGEAVRTGSPLLVPLPPRSRRREAGARGLLALTDVEHVAELGWGDDLLRHRGVNGFANAIVESGDDLRTMLRVLWWFRPRDTADLVRRTQETHTQSAIAGSVETVTAT
jgi:hypothetical protein